MDPGADPCQDYFAYACGGFVKNTEIPADQAAWSAGHQIRKETEEFLHTALEQAAQSGADPVTRKAGDFYGSCMDQDKVEAAGTTALAPQIASISKVTDFASLIGAITLMHQNGETPLFYLSPMQDFKDASLVVGALAQTGRGLPDRDYYLKNDKEHAETLKFYRAHVARMLALFGNKDGATDVLRIEGKIAKLQQDRVVRRDPHNVYHPVDRAGLTKLSPTFGWDKYFTAMGVPDVKSIILNDPGYYAGIEKLLHEEKPAAWRNYLLWDLAHENAPELSKAIVAENFSLTQQLAGIKELPPRWKRCVRATDSLLGDLIGQIYVAAKFAGDAKPRAAELTKAMHAALLEEMTALPWLDEATRAQAVAKLSVINDKVGYPDHWRAYDFTLDRATYAKNFLAAERAEVHRQLAKIGKPLDRNDWNMTAATVNAYYDPSLNEIVLPAAELQPPYFSQKFYAPVNIGDEGANTIGHELTHGFDDEGSQFDGQGNMRDWWSRETKAKFTTATECVREQYSQYEAVPGVKLNGALTSGENIADIGGIKLGFKALKAWQAKHPEEHRVVDGQNDERLFFLAYAQGWCSKERPEVLQTQALTDPHSPPRWRVNGALADVPAFAEAYQCAAKTPMHPENVCAVW